MNDIAKKIKESQKKIKEKINEEKNAIFDESSNPLQLIRGKRPIL